MHALEAKAPLVALPREERLAGDERRRIAARRDELDLGDQHALRVLLAKQDRAWHDRVHERRAERTRKAAAVRLHQVDARLAVDLRAAEEEHVDAALPGEVEELPRALGQRIRLAPLLQRDAECPVFLLVEQGAVGGNRGRSADGCMTRAIEQPRDYAGEKLFLGVRTHSSR